MFDSLPKLNLWHTVFAVLKAYSNSCILPTHWHEIWGTLMDSTPAKPSPEFRDFSDLYRAALAERDPDTKGMLLREVQKAINAREQCYDVLPPAAA